MATCLEVIDARVTTRPMMTSLEGLEGVFHRVLDCGGHGPRQWTIEEGYRRESRGGIDGDEDK